LATCKEHLRRIYAALQAYKKAHGEYPLVLTRITRDGGDSVEGLYPKYIDDPNVFLCPAVAFRSSFNPPGFVKNDYMYSLEFDPLRLQAWPAREARVKRFMRHDLPAKLGRDFTLVYCAMHSQVRAKSLLALREDGRIEWNPVGGTLQQKMRDAFLNRVGYPKPGQSFMDHGEHRPTRQPR
jgi:hypothetical protein